MAPKEEALRSETARRLKAARMLLGRVVTNENGKPRVVPLEASELASREPLAENRWTADRIGRIERMERTALPGELRLIEEALDLPGWLTAPDVPGLLAAGRTALALEATDERVDGPLPSDVRSPSPPD